MIARLILLAAILALGVTGASAAALRVMPISIERVAPAAAASLTLSDGGTEPINVQVRVFRWRQGPGGDILEPTRDVIVSPPILKLVPGTDYTVRVVRVAKTAIKGEEAYRILADELPTRAPATEDSITLLLRYSIPVFFAAAGAAAPSVVWSVASSDGHLLVRATNRGAARLRISQLSIGTKEKTHTLVGGLAGYVLGGSTMTWSIPAPATAPTSGAATLSFDTDKGKVDVPVVIKPGA
ncbi:MAG: molecular chaperone [Bauldia sp.]